MKIVIGADHAGFKLKEELKKHFDKHQISYQDKGCYNDERADYPDFAHAVANAIENKEADYGILICGSGNGINMAANKHKGIRSALCWMPEIAKLAREHNDANIIALPARYLTTEQAEACLKEFFSAKFEGGRHQGRIDKIAMC